MNSESGQETDVQDGKSPSRLRWVFIPGGMVMLASVIFLLLRLWEQAFLDGEVPGIYWLYVSPQQMSPVVSYEVDFPAVIMVLFVVAVVGVILMLIAARFGQMDASKIGTISLALFLLPVSLICFVLSSLYGGLVHEASATVDNRVYDLGVVPGYEGISPHYILVECDANGIVCNHPVTFNSQVPAGFDARFELRYDAAAQSLRALADGKLIGEFPLPLKNSQ